jgi:hypothetical protein
MENAHGTTKANHEDKASNQKMGERSSGSKKADHKEGPVARAIEDQTAKLPSDLFLWMAGATVVGSAALKVVEFVTTPRKERKGTLSVFVGMWAPTILLLGLYNKIVKVAGSDQDSQES